MEASWYRRFYVYVVLWPVILLLSVFMNGCVKETQPLFQKADDSLNVGGGDASAMQLPTSPGQRFLCTQGTDREPTHDLVSTRKDIDLDTSNDRDEALYAPCSGIVYVHDQDPMRGFGNHANIDRGDGTYCVVAHCAMIALQNRTEVTIGQFLGYEGCTGNCTGDHVHVGLHRGDASRPAELGESIRATYLVADASQASGYRLLDSEQFRCGIRAAGDPINGDRYESVLQIALFHPDGTLVKTLGSPKVYVLINGERRWIQNEAVFHSLRLSFNDVVLISDQELACYREGSAIQDESLIDAVQDPSGTRWLIVGARSQNNRYRAPIHDRALSTLLASWGISIDVRALAQVPANHDYLVNWPSLNTFALLRDGSLVKQRGRPDVYVISKGVPMAVRDWKTYLLLGFQSRVILEVDQGDLAFLHGVVGDCRLMTSCLSHETVTMCGGNVNDGQDVNPEPASFNIAVVRDDPPEQEPEAVPEPPSSAQDDESVPSDLPVEPVPSDLDAGVHGEPQPVDASENQDPDAGVQPESKEPVPSDQTDEPDAAVPAREPDVAVQPHDEPDAVPAREPDGAVVVEIIVEHDSNDDPPQPQDVDPEPSQNELSLLCDDLACIIDADQDGRTETLVMADDIWRARALETLDAYVYGNGGCFDSVLTHRDLVASENDYYFIDFSRFRGPCDVQLSLISSMGTDGQLPNIDRSNWNWWQNAEFCHIANPLCELMVSNEPWENWLLALSWDPVRGLVANGNGFTLNAQL